MKNGFCIILTRLRLYQGIALYRSLRYHMNHPRIFMLCMDDESFEVLLKAGLENATLIHVAQIEDELLRMKKIERKLNEYCWTLKPILLEHVLHRYHDVDRATYVDADLCFFSDPTPVFTEGANDSVLLSRHNYMKNFHHIEEICGKYNSGFISFKKDEIGMTALQWWRHKCLDWCFDRVEHGKFGDQKYLDTLAVSFPNILEIKTPGVNIGPWNDGRYKTSIVNHKVYINNVALICYHFAGLRILSKEEFAFVLGYNKNLREHIYIPYIHVLQEVIHDVEKIKPQFHGFFIEEYRRAGAEILRISR